MAERNIPKSSMKVKIINIVLYPVENQKIEKYIELINNIYNDKQSVNTFADRFTTIRSLYTSNNGRCIYGEFSNAAYFDPESNAIDRKTNEIVPANVDPNKGLGLKTWKYYFFPQYHRLIFDDSNSSESQIMKFLNVAINHYYANDDYVINTEKDLEFIDRIINSDALTKLYVRISYSNNGNYDDWKGLIDQQLKNSKAKTAQMQFSGSKKNPIIIADSEMIKGFVELSASNGYAEATETDSTGVSRKIKTIDHPMVRKIDFYDDPKSAMEELAQLLSNRSDNKPQ